MKTTMRKEVMLLQIFSVKEISDFVSGSTTIRCSVNGLTNAAYGENIMAARACMQDWVDAGRPGTARW